MHHQQVNGKPPPRLRPSNKSPSMEFLVASSLELVLLLLLNHIICPVAASPTSNSAAPTPLAGQCNFEKHLTGCYSQANFICDLDTNRCKCLPETPVLVEQRLCMKRAKPNESCQYNEQCDNLNGYYCTSSLEHLVEALGDTQQEGAYHQGKCRNLADINNNSSTHPRINNNNNNSTTSQQQYKQQHSQQPRHPSASGAHFTGSILPRLLWLFLVACLIGLVVLLFLIRSQQYRIEWYLTPEVVSSGPHQRDPASRHEEATGTGATANDVPPPYEVAIQMKS